MNHDTEDDSKAQSLYPKDVLENTRKLFILCDKNQTGAIEKDELGGVMNELGISEVGQVEIDTLMDSLDQNKDGKIDFEEFLIGVANFFQTDAQPDTQGKKMHLRTRSGRSLSQIIKNAEMANISPSPSLSTSASTEIPPINNEEEKRGSRNSSLDGFTLNLITISIS